MQNAAFSRSSVVQYLFNGSQQVFHGSDESGSGYSHAAHRSASFVTPN